MATAQSNKTRFSVNAKFSSFKELEDEIDKYQRDHYVQLYKRDSRTIEAAMRRAPNKKFKSEIKYSELVYCFIHGGKKFKSESKGKRPQQQ